MTGARLSSRDRRRAVAIQRAFAETPLTPEAHRRGAARAGAYEGSRRHERHRDRSADDAVLAVLAAVLSPGWRVRRLHRLQDECGADVNLFLFLLWLASERQQLSEAEVKKLDDNVRDWRALTIIPIRDARRKLKGASTLVEPANRKCSAPK